MLNSIQTLFSHPHEKSDQFLLGRFFGVQFKILSRSLWVGRNGAVTARCPAQISWALCSRCAFDILGCRCSAASSGWLITSRWDLKELALPHYIPLRLRSWQPQQLSLSLRDINTAALSGPDYAGTPSINRKAGTLCSLKGS